VQLGSKESADCCATIGWRPTFGALLSLGKRHAPSGYAALQITLFARAIDLTSPPIAASVFARASDFRGLKCKLDLAPRERRESVNRCGTSIHLSTFKRLDYSQTKGIKVNRIFHFLFLFLIFIAYFHFLFSFLIFISYFLLLFLLLISISYFYFLFSFSFYFLFSFYFHFFFISSNRKIIHVT